MVGYRGKFLSYFLSSYRQLSKYPFSNRIVFAKYPVMGRIMLREITIITGVRCSGKFLKILVLSLIDIEKPQLHSITTGIAL